VVGKNSQKILTLITHIGCFKVNRLLYSITEHQQIMTEIFKKIPGLVVCLADILISGQGLYKIVVKGCCMC
jgi:hypothetical protein